ncbi:MAG: FAD-dependent oxidoreductase, partial [Pseudomonadota bacterium]
MQTQVTIIGAGPVGLTAAMDLAQRGIDVVVVESRSTDQPADAKCNTIAARTMEMFRRLGVAEQARACGLTDDFPTDVVYATAANGLEITRIVQPSRNERFGTRCESAEGFPDSHWQ